MQQTHQVQNQYALDVANQKLNEVSSLSHLH